MNNEDNAEAVGDVLLRQGWMQGVLFKASSAYFVANVASDPGATELTTTHSRKVKSKETLVVVSQTCDISAREDVEPYVEALICSVQKQDFVDRLGPNSARWFLVDRPSRLVAVASRRVYIAKSAMLRFTPEPWPGTPEHLQHFVRWLARRYDRPALPDDIVAAFQNPLQSALRRLSETYPDIRAAFSRAVHEVRLKLPPSDTPPYSLQLILLLKSDGLTVEEADAIDTVMRVVRTQFDEGHVILPPEHRATAEELTLAAYQATVPVFLEHLTYAGDEVDGAEPLPRL